MTSLYVTLVTLLDPLLLAGNFQINQQVVYYRNLFKTVVSTLYDQLDANKEDRVMCDNLRQYSSGILHFTTLPFSLRK